MRRFIGALCCVGLLLAGCGPASEPKQTAPQEQSQGTKAVTFDDLLSASKLSMSTKLNSDLPKNWTYKGDEVKGKLEKLIAVLKQGKQLPPEEAVNTQHTIPMVIFIFDMEGGNKSVVNVFNDRFELGGQWYQLDQAPEKTYGSVEKLEEK
jgi:hypothetical protein